MGYVLVVLVYTGLSFRTPLQWTMPVWFALAFLVTPALIGYVTATNRRKYPAAAPNFRAGFQVAAPGMFLYAGINMMIARSHIGSSGDAGGTFLVGLAVAIAYALLAGVVAGAVSASTGKLRGR